MLLDATMLADAQRCLKLYDYRHNQGYNPSEENVDFLFGHLLDEALEIFEKALSDGQLREQAQLLALRHALNNSVDANGKPRFGTYQSVWHCQGTVPYKNRAGNAAKCPWSHKGKWFPMPAPPVCSCGSQTEASELWMPTKPGKDVDNLMALITEYTDGVEGRQLLPATYKAGPDAKEVPILQSYWKLNLDQGLTICGTFDAVKNYGNETFVVDYKTTRMALGATYWGQFQPNVQVDLYNMVAEQLLETKVAGVAIEAFHASASGTELGFRLFRSTEAQKEEMKRDVLFWVERIREGHKTDYWPRSRSTCFGCAFRKVCAADPSERESILKAEFTTGFWNPETRTKEATPWQKI